MNEESLFAAALARPGGAERQAFLDAACGGDAGLRERVEHLLAADEQTRGILDAAGDSFTTGEHRPHPLLSTATLFAGRYKLRQKLGEGGMGEVWVADQSDPVQRRVAVKVIRPGLGSASLLARFEAERQALALMDHPNIAKFLDAGVDGDRPYFVMELVKGVAITRYCDEARLSPRDRIDLFLDVCRAVQHAHQKGIIHRDLKPSNILVATYDGRPVPKVIDFGVAKATGPRLSEHSIYTEVGALVGTLEYMSPEQAELNNLDIDTRSDVYALGAVLYELLTGFVPFPRERLVAAGLAEMLRIIKEVEPPKPSTRLSSPGRAASVAAVRQSEPRKLAALVRGELDWIVMKALAKDRVRRYESATGLAHDLERYLADEPVAAGPPSAAYRVRKFARRHRLLLATAAGFAGLLVAGAAVATWQAVRASRAEGAEADQRRAAERNEQTATDERNKAVEASRATTTALGEERFTSYTHRIALAHREWLAGDITRARQLLDDCPADLRDWEWRYVRRLCNSELAGFRAHAGEVTSVAFSPDGARVASVSRTEVRVWDAATGREAFRIAGAGGIAASFRPDGKRLAVAWWEQVTVHDAADGKELGRIDPHDKPAGKVAFRPRLSAVAYGPDGRRLATAGSVPRPGNYPGGVVKVWDADVGTEVRRFADLPSTATGVGLSPDGKYIAASVYGTMGEVPAAGHVRVWAAADGKLLHALQGYEPAKMHSGDNSFLVTGVAFSPDGKRVGSSGSDGAVRVWELPGGRPVLTLQAPAASLYGLAFNPSGDRLATAGADCVVRVWDAATGAEINSQAGHTGPVRAVAFGPDGRRVASAGGDARVWDAAVGQQARVFVREPGAWTVDSVAFSPDGRLLAAAGNDGVTFHEVTTGAEQRPQAPIRPSAVGGDARVVFSPDGRTAATTGIHGVKLWDVATGAEVRFLPDHPEVAAPPYTRTAELAFSPDGRRLATVGVAASAKGGGETVLTVWETATGRIIHKIHYRAVRTGAAASGNVAFSPDGRRIAIATKGQPSFKVPPEVKVWDAESGQTLAPIAGGGGGLAFSPDGTRFASGNPDGTVTVWDAGTGAVAFILRGHTGAVADVAFSRDGRRLVSASADQTIRVWDPAAGKEVLALRGHGARVVAVRFSSDGHHLASAGAERPGQFRLWDARPVEP